MRLAAVIVFSALTAAASAQPRLHGFITTRAVSVDARPSWTAGDVGKFDVGGEDTVDVEIAQAGLDWAPRRWLTIHADGIVRREPGESKGSRGGLIQAFADVSTEKWRVRAGTFWLPTSRENIDPLWTSPYTLTYSALNAWIGQEVRPVGLDLQYSPNFYVTLGATAFRGNDTMGTVLADRGWTLGSRLSAYGEDLPRPDSPVTTRPVGEDLDGKNGYSGRIRFQLPERAMIQIAHVDNRAPLLSELKGQEPWLTRFTVLSGQVGVTSPTIIAAEWLRGSTTIGFPGGTAIVDLDTAYVLVSHKRGANRWSGRVEQFSTSDEDGHAITVAWLRDMSPQLRLGAEYVRVTADRPLTPDPGGSTITVELRYRF